MARTPTMLAGLAPLLLCAQQPGTPSSPDDAPVRIVVELDVPAEGAQVSLNVDFDGIMHVWVESESVDPRLGIVDSTGAETVDEDSGGGTTPYLAIAVEGEPLPVTVESDVPGRVVVYAAGSSESDATRAAAEAAEVEDQEIRQLRGRGETEEARVRARALAERLLSVDGAAESTLVLHQLVNLAGQLQVLHEMKLADACYEPVEDGWRRRRPRSYPWLHFVLLQRAQVRKSLGDHTRARDLERELVALFEEFAPTEYSNLIAVKSALSSTLQTLGDIEGAHEVNLEMYDMSERLLPQDDPNRITAMDNLANTLRKLGQLERARELGKSALEARLRTLPEDDLQIASTRCNLALTLKALGDLRGALALEEAALEVMERRYPATHLDRLITQSNLAATRYLLGDLRVAADLFEDVREAQERLLSPDHPHLLTTLENLAIARRAFGDVDEALALQERVHAARERTLPPDNPDLLMAKQNLAATLELLGDLRGANTIFEQVLAIVKESRPEGHPDLLNVMFNLAVTRGGLGDLKGSHELYEEIHAAYERTLPRDHPNLLLAKRNLSGARADMGDAEGAIRLNRELLSIEEGRLAEDHPDLLAARLALGNRLCEMKDFVGAEEQFERVLALQERALPDDHPDLLDAKMNLAVVCNALGDLPRALGLFEEVHDGRQHLPADNPDLLDAKTNLASARILIGDMPGVLELLEHVYGVRARILAPDHPDRLSSASNLSAAYRSLGRIRESLELDESIVAIRESRLSPDHPALLSAKTSLALSRRLTGELTEARRLMKEVVEGWSRLVHEEHPDRLRARQRLAQVQADLGDTEVAHQTLVDVHAGLQRFFPADHAEVLDSEESLVHSHRARGDLRSASEAARSLLARQLAIAETLLAQSPRIARVSALRELDRLPVLLSVAATEQGEELEGLNAELFSVLESLRSVSTSSPRVVREAARLPELREARAEVARARKRLHDLGLAPPLDAAELSDWRTAIFEASEQRDRLERELRRVLRDEVGAAELPDAERVARGLSADSALVAFFRYPRELAPDPDSGTQPDRVDSLFAFVVTPDAEVRRLELGPSAPWVERVIAWRERLGAPVARGGGRAASGPPSRGIGPDLAPVGDDVETGRALHDAIVGPCVELLGDLPGTLHVILDDFLHLVPFEALPVAGGRRLGDVLEVRYEVSAERLLEVEGAAEPSGTLVAVGGVDFDAEGVEHTRLTPFRALPAAVGAGLRAGAGGRFEPLDQTLAEVEALACAFRERTELRPVVLTGDSVTKNALSRAAPSARFLHLATHGWFAPESLGEADPADLEARAERARAQITLRGFAPETLCGLALAGANRGADESGEVAGLLTAEELAGIDLSACELAVLSACETNVGIRRAGQGIQSLQTALHAAGARTAITSLWKVDDAATRKLMERFYTYLWVDELGKADALWKAKCDLRAEGHPVRDWAAWVLSGDPD